MAEKYLIIITTVLVVTQIVRVVRVESKNGTLIDGYSAYMVAKMLGHDTLKGIVCPTAQEIAEA